MGEKQIIFDMDGVITSEDGYWRAAECALLDLAAHLGHPASRAAVTGREAEALPWRLTPDRAMIARVKALRITTNWDLCHVAALGLVRKLGLHDPGNVGRLLGVDWASDAPCAGWVWPADFAPSASLLLAEGLAEAGGRSGFELLAHLAELTPGTEPLLRRKGPVWQWLFRHFQDWFNGTPDRKGIREDEQLLLAPGRIAATLDRLAVDGWKLGVATGRTRAELLPTLARFGLADFFSPEALVTHDEVAAAEAELAARGIDAHLSKPHPFPFLRALFPTAETAALASSNFAGLPAQTVIVGDTVADIAAAVTLGARAVGVLTGPAGSDARGILADAGATDLLTDMTELPDLLIS